jgi:two-component system chemotaxis sensor kinase CheA
MDDLVGEFVTETVESLAMLDQELVRLEQNPNDKAILSNIFRSVHTIKGASGFLGLPRLGALAHAAENVLGMIRDGELDATPQAITLVLTSLDTIKGMVDYLGEHGKEPEGDDGALIEELNRFAGGAPVSNTGPEYEIFAETDAAAAPTEDFSTYFAGDDDLNALIEAEQKKKASAPDKKPDIAPAVAVAAKPAAKAEAPKEATAAKEGAAMAQSIRVNIEVLENLMQMVGELVLSRNQLVQLVRTHTHVQQIFQSPIQQMSYIATGLQEGIMKTRMQPISGAWAKFPRLIRDLSLEVGKKIELKMSGEETELDRQLLELIKDPLTHMVRNSCDHGLESPEDRIAAGKPETGTVTLSAFHEGGQIIIEIGDDGRGLNIDRIKKKALENGITTPAELEALTEQQIMQFIFRAGFSTAEKVTAVSGRGVGMDVVRTNIEKMGGTIELFSALGKGSKFSIKIPLTLAIIPVLIIEAGGERFALPQINVLELVETAPGAEYAIEMINQSAVLRLREKLLPLGSLSGLLDLNQDAPDWTNRAAQVVVCKVGGNDFGLIIDRVHDTEEIVVKPVSTIIKDLPCYSGNTILGDGNVIMILDPNYLAKEIGSIHTSEQTKTSDTQAMLGLAGEREVNFLLFKSGKGAPKAVPLELISRLEEIEVSSIEMAGIDPVVQYRGDLMRLVTLGDFYLPGTPLANVIVFSYDRKNIGLIVDEIIDIVPAQYDIKIVTESAEAECCLGSMVIAGKTTDVVDVSRILSDLVDQAIADHRMRNTKGAPRNLLLVEDSPFFRNITEPLLAAAGYNVTSVENGEEALELLSQYPNRFHLLVTDIEMPNMDGLQLTTACRNHPVLRTLPIVAYTASESQETMERTRMAGVNACILKTDRPGLLEAVAHHLTVREMAA